MNKIKSTALIALFEKMYREKWPYEWGAACEGCVDCSGAFVYAYKKLASLSIYHGSNTIFRQSIGGYATRAIAGYAAFKVRPWQESESGNRWYGKAPGDVYHIGLVAEDERHVLNAKGTNYGFRLDDIKGWTYFAPLIDVDYSDGFPDIERTVLYQAIVATDKDPLAIREGRSTDTRKIGSIPKGEIVDVYSEDKNWSEVRYGQIVGNAFNKYLKRIGEDDAPSDESHSETPQAVTVTTTLIRDDGKIMTIDGAWRIAQD